MTTGAVASTVTVPLWLLSLPTQLVPNVGVSVYCHLPSGTFISVHVIVTVPVHDVVAVTDEPVGTGYRFRAELAAGTGPFPTVVLARANVTATVVLFAKGVVDAIGVAPWGSASAAARALLLESVYEKYAYTTPTPNTVRPNAVSNTRAMSTGLGESG